MSALQFYVSLKAPGIEGIVGLQRLAGLPLPLEGRELELWLLVDGNRRTICRLDDLCVVVWCSTVAVAEFV